MRAFVSACAKANAVHVRPCEGEYDQSGQTAVTKVQVLAVLPGAPVSHSQLVWLLLAKCQDVSVRSRCPAVGVDLGAGAACASVRVRAPAPCVGE